MAKSIPNHEIRAIEAAIRSHPNGVSARQIAREASMSLPLRTLQYRLKHLVEAGRLAKVGKGRGTKYRLLAEAVGESPAGATAPVYGSDGTSMPLSKESAEIRDHLRRPLQVRKPVGYNREFLDAYRPNVSFRLSRRERAHLREVGQPGVTAQPAATYVRRILNRLLVDLSWNSSRLEGNTYSLLDTKRLIEFGQEAEGRTHRETQMILNHKDAIEFLVQTAAETGFSRYTILNLHAILAGNLLANPTAAGRLRHMAVGIEQSAFHPLETPQVIEECFDQILTATAAIHDPFEQSFFFMTQLPYLQPFDDVNKRVSRLGANIPFIIGNLCPLSFIDVPRSIYTEAMLGVYELNRVDLLKDAFIWAYERSAARYAAIRQSIGEPDPFQLRHRDALRETIGEIVRQRMDRRTAFLHIAAKAQERMAPADQNPFREAVEREITGLHEGNHARHRINPAEFDAWRHIWKDFENAEVEAVEPR